MQHCGCRLGGICCSRDCNSCVGFLQGRGIVYPVTSHADDVSSGLKQLYYLEFVLRKYLGKTVCLFDDICGLFIWFVDEVRCRLNIGS